MADDTYYLLGEQTRNIDPKDSMVGVQTGDLTEKSKWLSLDTEGDVTFFLQYSIDGVNWTTYPDSDGWALNNTGKIIQVTCSGYLRGMARNDSSTNPANNTQMTLFVEDETLYCSIGDAYRQAYPGINTGNVSSDLSQPSEVQDFIRDAMGEIDQECYTSFTPQTITEYHDGNGTMILYPRKYPIISVTSLTINDDSLTETTHFVVYPTAKEGGCIAIAQGAGYVFYLGQRNIVLEYTYGYSSIPRLAEVTTAQLAAIKMLISHTGGTYNDRTSYQIGDISASKGEPAANLMKAYQYLAGLVGKPGQFEKNLDLLKKYVGKRIIDYTPRWGWIA